MDSAEIFPEDENEVLNLTESKMLWARSDTEKQIVYNEIYNEIQTVHKKIYKLKPKERIFTPERILLLTPQINKLAYDNQDKKTRAKMLQAACESPNIVTMFHKNKLFAKGKDANSKFISKTIPVQAINKNDFSKLANKTYVKKSSPKGRYSYITKDFKSALGKIKHSNIEPRSSSRSGCRTSNPRSRKNLQDNLCLALQSIEKQCELSINPQKLSESVDNIHKQQKTLQLFTNRVHWTACKLQKWGNLDNSLIKELFEYEKYSKSIEKINANDITQSLQNKSSKDIRDQAKFIKKILIKKKMKVLYPGFLRKIFFPPNKWRIIRDSS